MKDSFDMFINMPNKLNCILLMFFSVYFVKDVEIQEQISHREQKQYIFLWKRLRRTDIESKQNQYHTTKTIYFLISKYNALYCILLNFFVSLFVFFLENMWKLRGKSVTHMFRLHHDRIHIKKHIHIISNTCGYICLSLLSLHKGSFGELIWGSTYIYYDI